MLEDSRKKFLDPDPIIQKEAIERLPPTKRRSDPITDIHNPFIRHHSGLRFRTSYDIHKFNWQSASESILKDQRGYRL